MSCFTIKKLYDLIGRSEEEVDLFLEAVMDSFHVPSEYSDYITVLGDDDEDEDFIKEIIYNYLNKFNVVFDKESTLEEVVHYYVDDSSWEWDEDEQWHLFRSIAETPEFANYQDSVKEYERMIVKAITSVFGKELGEKD